MRLLIESDPHGVRMGVLEGRRLVEYHSEQRETSRVGDVYLGRVRRLAPAIDAAFIDIGLARNAFLHSADFRLEEGETLGVNEPIVVQVFRDPLPNKGARVRRGASLPGRYLVLLAPGEGVAISTRIEGAAERERLTEVVGRVADGTVGWIARTAAEGVEAELLQRDAEGLLVTWREIERAAADLRPPRRLHRDLEPVERWLRDRVGGAIEEIWVEDESTRQRVTSTLVEIAPHLTDRVMSHESEVPLFEHHGAENQVAAILDRRVELPSGGSLVIEPTEALVAIDINSGSDLAGATLEETALATNLEAATEVARQLRLRDLAGIIVIDFIDLAEAPSWDPVIAALEAELSRDKAATQVEGPAAFGLVAITRKRGRRDLWRRSTVACEACDGTGRVRSRVELLAAARRSLRQRDRRSPGRRWRLELPVGMIGEGEPPLLLDLRSEFGERLEVSEKEDLRAAEFSVAEAR